MKGVREGLLVSLGDAAWEDLRSALLKHVDEGGTFFKGARIAIDVGKTQLNAAELSSLRDDLSDKGVALWAVLSTSSKTETTAQVLGLATKLSSPRRLKENTAAAAQPDSSNAIFLRRTLRSGVIISSPGNVIIIGDVNPGAVVEAAGSVIIWGRLKGSVHAGKDGCAEETISALEFQSTQVRIAGIDFQPQGLKKKNIPQTALVRGEQISVVAWNGKGK